MNTLTFLNTVKKIDLKRWYIPVIVTTLFFIFFFVLFTPIYETNDDVFFTLIANGYYTKTPTPYFQITSGIQTIHIVVGKLLVFLYSSFPDFNWYSFLMYSLAFLGLYALLIPVFHTLKNRLLLGILLVLLLLFVTRLLLFLSFTSIAAIGTMGGIFLLLFLIKTNRYNSFYFFLVGVLLISSQLVRQTSFVMVVIFSLPLIIKIFIGKKKGTVIFLTLMLLVLSSIWVVRYTNISAYRQNAQWNEKMSFLLPLGTFFYEPNTYSYVTKPTVYKSIDWSKNDYVMFTNFFYDEQDIFSADKLHTLLASSETSTFNFPSIIKTPFYFVVLIFSMFEYTLICIVYFIIAWPRISYKDKIYVLFSTAIVSVSMLYFIYKGYIAIRVILSMLFFISYTALFSISDTIEFYYKKAGHKVFFKYIFISSFILVLSVNLLELNNANKKKIENLKQIIKTLPNNNSLTLIWGSSIPYHWQYVFSSNSEFKNIHFLSGAWQQRSPLNEEIKKKFNIDNIYRNLYTRKNFYLLASESQKDMLQVFMKEHYRVLITYDVLYDYSAYGSPTQLLKVNRVK